MLFSGGLILVSLAISPLVFALAQLADNPQFVFQPRDTSAVSGETVTLYCSVSGHDQGPGQFVWIKDGGVITRGFDVLAPDSHRFSIGGVTGVGSYNLIIADTKASDSGSYRCVVTAGGTGLISNTASLQIWASPTTEYPRCAHGAGSDDAVAVAETLTLACDVEGGNPKAQLFLNTGDIAMETRETTTGIAYDWTVAETDESAEFVCIGKQRFWAEHRTCTMGPFRLVLDPPTVSLVPTETTVQAGQSVSFLCNAESAPRAAYMWLVGGQEVDGDAGAAARMTVQAIGSSSVLLVHDAGNEDQSIQIMCVVNAATGNASARALMHVEPVYTVVTGPLPTREPSSAETDQPGQGAPSRGTPTEEDDEDFLTDEGLKDYLPSNLYFIVGGAVAGVVALLIVFIVVIALVARRGRASNASRSTEKLAEGAPDDNDVYFRSRFVGVARSWLFPVHRDTQKGMAASMASRPNRS